MLMAGMLMAVEYGTLTQTAEKQGPIVKTTFTWTMVGTGTDYVSKASSEYIRGEVLRVVFDPVTTTYPTNNYTITMKDTAGIDLLAGLGEALSSNTVTSIRPGIASKVGTITNVYPFAVNDLVTITVTNSGASTSGKLILYTR